MALGRRARILGAIGLALAARELRGQTSIKATVVAAVGQTPIANATVRARRSGVATTTDRLGRSTIRLTALPDTLIVTAIGWQPDTIAILAPREAPLEIGLARSVVVISDLIATAPPLASLDGPEHGRWTMPLAAARTVPPAVETDVYRALALVPAVSFTSPLSARPMIRGYDAQEVVTRIDGFEVLNLFHLGRIFSSYPADATEELTVSAAPYPAASGGSVSGLIDVIGRTGPTDGVHGALGTSFGSLSGSVGGGNHEVRLFGAGRFFHAKLLELIPGVDVPYHFEDGYASAVFGPPDRPRGRVTLFATQDRAGQSIDHHLNWDNVLLGSRWRVVDRSGSTLEVAGSLAQFREDGVHVPAAHRGPADFENRFVRMSSTADLTVALDRTRLAAGVQLGVRRVRNAIRPSPIPGPAPLDFPATDARFERAELAGYAQASHRIGSLTVETAVRMDWAGGRASVEPRLHARWAPGHRASASLGVGRTSRLYHLIADARSEPDLDFLDFWINAGDTVPAARVDHATLDLNLDWAPVLGRLSLFASRGTGIGELRPETDQRPSAWSFVRFGRARTRGIEAQIAYRGTASGGRSLSVSYVYSVSDRDWGKGWLRWSQDRRHQFRIFGQARHRRFTLFAALDAATGMPLTPVAYQLDSDPPGLPPDVAPETRRPRRIFGPENSLSTSGTLRVDGGLTYGFKGPRASRFTLGASVINLFWGKVAPIGTVGNGTRAADANGTPTEYRRLFDLPGIPTLTLRIEF